MLDASFKRFATRQLAALALAAGLGAGLALLGAGSDARTVSAPSPSPAPAPANTIRSGGLPLIEGSARVVDGDTLVVGDVRIRLEGIDAPEMGQYCRTSLGQPWPCGTRAAAALSALIADHRLSCRDQGLDKYGRTLATCFVGGRDINGEMVRLGMAWAFVRYSRAYVALEAEARRQHAGIWDGDATPAWDYRSGRWQEAQVAAPAGCAIKGNVTASGRIYHTPWSPWYEKVRMDGGHGKRWFCSEAEAVEAGWRPALMR